MDHYQSAFALNQPFLRRKEQKTCFFLLDLIKEVLSLDDEIQKLATELYQQKSVLIMGRGYHYATCLEGALVSNFNLILTSFIRTFFHFLPPFLFQPFNAVFNLCNMRFGLEINLVSGEPSRFNVCALCGKKIQS